MAEPNTRIIGNDSDTFEYVLAPDVFQYIESVYAVINNAAGGEARPVLKVLTQNRVVMAAKRQGESIPAGEANGSATWALRLDDEGGGGGGAATIEQEFLADVAGPFGTLVNPGATALAPWTHLSGSNLLDLTTPTAPSPVAHGFYIFDCSYNVVPSGAVTGGKQMAATLTFTDGVIPIGIGTTFTYTVVGVGYNGTGLSLTREGFPNSAFSFAYVNGDTTAGHTANFQLTATVTKIG